MSFDKYSELDPAKMQRDIEEMHGSAFFDKYAVLDDHHRVNQIEQAFGVQISNSALLDPLLLMKEVVIADTSTAPAWVPANAKIHIDFVNNRAWTEAAGEVAINTLLGSDANTENGWSETTYNPAELTSSGLIYSDLPPALIGSARSMVLSGATVRVQEITVDPPNVNTVMDFVLMSVDGNDALEARLTQFGQSVIESWGGDLHIVMEGVVNASSEASGIVNAMALTVTDDRLELAVNGSAASVGALLDADRPAANPLAAIVIDLGSPPSLASHALQSITIYDPLPDTTGLSALSEVT